MLHPHAGPLQHQEAPRPHTPRPSHAAIISPAICVQSKRRARLEAEWTGTRVTDDDDNASGDNDRAPAATATHGTGVYGSAQKRPEVDDGVLDQRVSDRMLKRIFTFAGVPVLLGLLLFPGFYYLVAIKRVELPMGTVFVTQALVFGAGLLGITYGATSASWDPDHEGSALGWQEFRTNFAAIMGKYGKE